MPGGLQSSLGQVGQALEGWVAGSSIPCDATNAERLRARLAEMAMPGRLCLWDGGDGGQGGASGRRFAVPHIKTYCRFRPSDRRLAWAIVASHNLSQAAWGKCEKNGMQLYIKSYELGVLLLPSLLPSSGPRRPHNEATALYAPSRDAPPPPPGAVVVPLPYTLPPIAYGPTDQPWTYQAPVGPRDRHGRTVDEPHGGFYGPHSWAREICERVRRSRRG